MTAARGLGLDVADVTVEDIAGEVALVVKRFDRAESDGQLVRIHQEDFCQALGLPPARRYEINGGPSIAAIVEVLRD
jgi:serine/threonine-protein kinase HipA